jgi:RNA polymerase sigma-70 factor, ECF subfamily
MTRRERAGVAVAGSRDDRAVVSGSAGRGAGRDEQAFAVLWRELQPVVLRYLRVMAPAAAEDLAADAWVSVIRGFGRFRGDEREFRR